MIDAPDFPQENFPLRVDQAWGKADSATGRYHLLEFHAADVAATMGVLLEDPVWRRRFESAAKRRLTDTDLARLQALAFLHDVGKLHPGFQGKARALGEACPGHTSHLDAGWQILEHAFEDKDHPLSATIKGMENWLTTDISLIAATFAHHGRPVCKSAKVRPWPSLPAYDWRAAASHFAATFQAWHSSAFADASPLPREPAFQHLYAGLLTLADWIGSDEREFPFSLADDDYPFLAARRARDAVKAKGLALPERTIAPGVSGITGFHQPRPAQDMIAGLSVDEQMVILEAETGSGKTEAALIRFAKLWAQGAVTGLYFALPTRAAARQLHGRVTGTVRRLWGPNAPEPVLAIPGQPQAGDAEGRRLPDWSMLWDDEPEQGRQRARWAAEHAPRYLAAAVAVGTIDQAMLSGLKVKHAHARGAALARSLLVVDEVHASDAFMSAILRPLLAAHRAIGGHVLLMSATLGAVARARWLDRPRPCAAEAERQPYPAIWTGQREKPVEVRDAGRSRTVRLQALQSWEAEALAQAAIANARQGAHVLVIRNQVDSAMACWRAVRMQGAEDLLLSVSGLPALHHARFAHEDRRLLDEAVEAALAPDPARPAAGRIVIGTQTLEQSLDIDADLLITDLCPMDVLLQRIGRLHRHRLPRPNGYVEARCLVGYPEGGLDHLAAPAFENGLGAWSKSGALEGIYPDLAVAELTRQLIEEHPVWEIPRMNRFLVERATHPEHKADLLANRSESWREYDRRLAVREAVSGEVGGMQVLNRGESFAELRFPGNDERVMTRLGAPGPVLRLGDGAVGPFGTPVSRITIPAHMAAGVESDEAEITGNEAGLQISVGQARFTYTLEGLRKQASVT